MGFHLAGANSGVAFYDALTDTPITTATGIPYPTELTSNPTGTKWYVLSSPPTGNGAVFWINSENFNVGTISVINTASKPPSVLMTVPVGTNPVGVAFAPIHLPFSF